MKEAFYCNIPCKILADLTGHTGDMVIEINTAEIGFNGGYQEPDYSEPVFSTLIVRSKYITDKYIDVEKEIKTKRDDMEKEIRKMREEANSSIREERKSIELSIQTLRDRAKKFSAMEQMLLYLEGEMNWVVVCEDYYFEVKGMNSLSKEETDGWGRGKGKYTLQALIFRENTHWGAKDQCRMDMMHSEYEDGSGSKRQIRGFKTEEEAVSFGHTWILDQIKKGNSFRESFVKFSEKYSLNLKGAQEFKDEQARRAEESRLKEIERKEQELQLLKEGKSCLRTPKNA